MFEPAQDAAAMARLGLGEADFAEDVLEVWPENWQAVCVLSAMASQWRTGPGGPIGLDYNTLPFVLRMEGVPRADWPEVFDCIRVMEPVAREAICR